MKKWIFAGSCDKSDMLLYLCKILAQGGRRVLLVYSGREDHYVQCTGPLRTGNQLVEYCGFDVAAGSGSVEDILRNLSEDMSYDYMLVDAAEKSSVNDRTLIWADELIWVNSFEVSGLMKDAEWLQELQAGPNTASAFRGFHRIYINVIDGLTNDSYIESYMEKVPVRWLGEPLRMPWDELSFALSVDNQHAGRLRLRPLSRRYKRALMELISRLSELQYREVRRSLRLAERRQA